MSNSVRPHRQQLPHPWDSPGKNTGVGCHCLLQRMKVKNESEVAQSCPTLRDPMDCCLPGSSVHGIFPARGLEWVAIAFSDGLSYMTFIMLMYFLSVGFPDGASGKEFTYQCRRYKSSIIELRRSPGGGHSNPLQYSCLENPMDRGAWWAIVHMYAESDMTEAT